MIDKNKIDLTYEAIGDDKEFRERYGERIGVGMAAVIYARDGIVAKVFRENQSPIQAFMEGYSMAVINEYKIPAPKVYGVERFAGRNVLLMEQVKGISLLDATTEDISKAEEYLDLAVKLQVELHKIESNEFRPIKMMIRGMILASPALTPEEKERLLGILSSLPDGFNLCHGDFHVGNVLYADGSCIIIDWAEVSCGVPEADACRSYVSCYISQVGAEEIYLKKYCAATGRKRDDILAWLPVIAGSTYGFLSPKAMEIVRPLF